MACDGLWNQASKHSFNSQSQKLGAYLMDIMTLYFDLMGYLALHPVQSFFILLIEFILIMKIHHKNHNKYLHILLTLWFIPQDVIVNAVLFTIVGFEIPQEWTVTARLKRWKQAEDRNALQHWRFSVGWRLCDLLSRFDAGHC